MSASSTDTGAVTQRGPGSIHSARKPGGQRREEICAAVLSILGDRGLRAVTTARLAREVGLTGGALYRHFASLDEILIETARTGVEALESTFPDSGLPPRERLLELARRRVELLAGNPGLLWMLRSEQAERSLPAQAVASLRAMVQRSRSFLRQALEDGIAEGSVRGDLDAELLLVPVLGTVHAVIGLASAGRGSHKDPSPDPERVLQALLRLLAPPSGVLPTEDTP